MDPGSGANAQAVASALREVIGRITGDLSGVWVGLDVTIPQMKILMRLRQRGPMRVGALAEEMGVSPPTVTATVRRLVRQGLVERRDDPRDRRVVLNLLSERGEGLMRRLGYRTDEEVLGAIGTLSAEEHADLLRLLHRLSAAFDEPTPRSWEANGPSPDADF